MSEWLTTALATNGVVGKGVTEMTANLGGIIPVALGVVVAVLVGKLAIGWIKKFISPAR